MTFVDDNLLGTAAIRSGKSGSKSAGKMPGIAAANQQSSFGDAFADAGKKKQPVISIAGKQAADAKVQLNLADARIPALPKDMTLPKDATATPAIGSDVDLQANTADMIETGTAENEQEFVRGFVAGDDVLKTPAIGNSVDDTEAAVADDPLTAEPVVAKVEFTPVRSESKNSTPPSASFANLPGSASIDAGKTVDAAAGAKVDDLLKDPKAQISSSRAPEKQKTEEVSPLELADDANAEPADVTQLLTMLGATQQPVTTAPVVAAETASAMSDTAMSEFQGLADRAGKGKAGASEGTRAEGASRAGRAGARAPSEESAIRNATQAGTDQVFRFARADGKGQAVSMSLAADGDKATVKNDASAASAATAKAETVTVLEARRYLGLAPTGNASAVTSQIAGNPEWARALQPSAAASTPLTEPSTSKVVNTLKIQMHPIDLGMVTATLRLKDDELHVELKVESAEAFRQLSDDQNAMVKALRAQGFAVDQVNIVFNASDSSGGGSQQQAQPQAGQQGREASGDGAAQGRNQRNEDSGQQQAGERWAGNDGKSDASSGADAGRTGDVYM